MRLSSNHNSYNARKVNEQYGSYADARVVSDIVNASYAHPSFKLEELRDCLSLGQLSSKVWLADCIRQMSFIKNLKTDNILVVGGWVGSLSRILFGINPNYTITSIDIDPRVKPIAETVNDGYRFNFRAETANMYNITDYSDIDLIINTSCEHIQNLEMWLALIPKDKIVILQSNDFDCIPEHINCVYSIDEFVNKLGNNQFSIMYSGQCEVPGVYTRYMLIIKT